jgi:osmotically-inducible protein OsmY
VLFFGGVGGAAYVATDRRTSDTVVADQRIEFIASTRLSELGTDLRVSNVAFNRKVLLTGPVRTAALRERAVKAIASIEGVREVFDEMTLVDPLPESDLPAAALLSTEVKARMVGNGVFNPLHVRVNSDQGSVYLMGLVNKAEADEASRIASTTRNVKRVVRLFEIMAASAPAPVQKAPD